MKVPASWSSRPLGELVEEGSDSGIPSEVPTLPYIGMEHVESVTGRVIALASPNDYKSSSYIAKSNQVLYGRLRPYLNKVFIPDREVYVSREFIPLTPGESLNSKFLLYLLRSSEFVNHAMSLNSGDRPRVKWQQIESCLISTPPLAEQEEIVRILEEQFSRLDAAAASIAAVRRKADQFRRSLLHAAFSGALTEPGSSWSTARLGDVCKVVSGSTPKTSVSAYWGGDIQWLTPNDLSKTRSKVVFGGERTITKAGFDSCSTQMVPAGSVLFTSRAPIGYVAIAGDELCTNQGFKSAIPGDSLSSEFLYWQLQALTNDIRSRASGTTFLEISGRGFAATELVIPPIETQQRLVELIDVQIGKYESTLQTLDVLTIRIAAMRRSLLHAAFSGELTKEWREKNNG